METIFTRRTELVGGNDENFIKTMLKLINWFEQVSFSLFSDQDLNSKHFRLETSQ